MRPNAKPLTVAIAAAALIATGLPVVPAQAEPVAERRARLRQWRAERPAQQLTRWRELDLSAEQREQIRAILQEHRRTVQSLQEQLQAEQRTLRELIAADSIDEAAIRAQAEKIGKVTADLAVERAKIAHAIRQVLTPEQRTRLNRWRAEARERAAAFRDWFALRWLIE